MTLLPKVKLKVLPTFPANIIGGTGIETTSLNGNVVVDLDYSDFGTISAVPTSPTSYVLTWDSALNSYIMVPSHLLGGAVAGISDAPVDGFIYGRQSAAWVKALALSGGTLTGTLTLNADPVAALDAATRQYVDSHPGSGAVRYDAVQTLSGAEQAQARSNIGVAGSSGGGVPYPDFWNGSFSVWLRGTLFSFTGGTSNPDYGQYTADMCSNGAGTGAVANVQKYTLNTIEQAAITPSVNPPSTGMRMTWTTKPTAGGGASQVGYPNYASYIELKSNSVANYAGKQVTVSCWIRCATGQTLPFYLYVGLGGLSNTGSTTNTISGTGAGVDYNSGGSTEIFYRSARMTTAAGPTWQRFSYTITLDPLFPPAAFGAAPVVNIGIGMDFGDITNSTDIYVTALTMDMGPSVQPWREWPDEAKYALAVYNFQRAGIGSVGFVLNATTIRLSLNWKGIIKNNGSAGGGLFMTPGVNPTALLSNGSSATGSSSAIAGVVGTAYGMIVDVNGFTGLTPGMSCLMVNDFIHSAQG